MQITGTVQRDDIGDVLNEFALEESRKEGFIGLEIYKPYYVAEQNGTYPVVPVEEFLKKRETRRASGAAFSRGSTKFEQASYACEEFGWEEPVDLVEKMDDAKYFDQEVLAGEISIDTILRDLESDIITQIEALSATSVTYKWSAPTTATPRADVVAGITSIMNATGLMPDTLAITWTTMQNVMLCDEFTNSSKYTSNILQSGIDTQKQMLADYFGIKRLVIASAVANGADEGLTYSASQMLGNAYGLLCITGDSNLKSRPQLGRTFFWDKLGGQTPYMTDSYDEPQTKSNIIRVHNSRVVKNLQTTAGYLMDNLA